MGWVNRPTDDGYWQRSAPPSPWAPTPAGYDATLPNLGQATTLMPLPGYAVPLLGTVTLGTFPLGAPARDPTVGVFIRDQGLVPSEVGGLPYPVTYIEADALDGGIGDFVLGETHIDYLRPYHGLLADQAGPDLGSFILVNSDGNALVDSDGRPLGRF